MCDIANVIVTPELYDRDRLVVTRSKFLLVEGTLQNQDKVIHVKAIRLAERIMGNSKGNYLAKNKLESVDQKGPKKVQ